jgi:predicted CXXCH cytochrome family protein
MKRYRVAAHPFARACSDRSLAGFIAALALSLLGMAAHAAAASSPAKEGLSTEDKACLECHAKPDLAKSLANGERLSLFVAAKGFAASVHGSSGCEGCHTDIDQAHSKGNKPLASKRSYALELMETCRDCHKKTMKQYEDSVHSALVRAGSEKAPLCSDCHNPHATRSVKEKAQGPAEPVVCRKCHEGIAQAFVESVHGRSGDEALVCKDCHHTHNVTAAAFGDHLKNECVSCHKEVQTSHAVWLPNAQRHLDAVSCPACHSPGATRRVNLRLYEGNSPQQAEKLGVPKFVRLASGADTKGSGLDARALWSLLQEFNQDGTPGKTVVRGRLEVQTGVQAHQLAAKGLAIKDCDTCHREGAASFQSVTISMAGPDGRPLRHDASKGILNSIESVGSVGGFYAIGSTRIKLLDTLLLMALGAGILIPLAHLLVKLTSKRRLERAQFAQLRAAPDGGPTSSGATIPGGTDADPMEPK